MRGSSTEIIHEWGFTCTCMIYHVKGVVKKRIFWQKLTFLRYSTSESGMIVEFFSCRSYIEILFSRPAIRFSRFRIPRTFREISRKIPGNFSENSRKFPGNFPTPTHHPPTHPYPYPTSSTSDPVYPSRTLNRFISKCQFSSKYAFFNHTLQVWT